MNKHAQALGRLNKGGKKRVTEADKLRRAEQGRKALLEYNQARKALKSEHT